MEGQVSDCTGNKAVVRWVNSGIPEVLKASTTSKPRPELESIDRGHP